MASILVVDDDKQFREMLSEILTDEGYSVTGCETGKEAIEQSFVQLFNVAIIDIHLPDMEGTELLSKLRRTEPETIKIIITGKATLDNSIEAANKGVDGYVVKPIDYKKLIVLIENKLKRQTQRVEFDEKKVAEYISFRHEWMANARINKKK